jgi:hypothetical protein
MVFTVIPVVYSLFCLGFSADTVTNIDETTEEKKEDLDDSLSNSSSGK